MINENVKKIILEKLDEIEKRENVKIIYCIESGSRAWGFESTDSDYDVRFVYVRKKEEYLKLYESRDVIEWQLDDTLDINGWDVKKFLKLLYTSNPTTFEWYGSKIVYKETEEWKEIKKVLPNYFASKKGLYHYLSMAKGNYREYLQGDVVRLKKYFYVLRPILACEYILKFGKNPPMLFEELLEECLPKELKEVVGSLLDLKRKSTELGEGNKILEINDYIESQFTRIEEKIKDIPDSKNNDIEILDRIFLKVIE